MVIYFLLLAIMHVAVVFPKIHEPPMALYLLIAGRLRMP